MTLKLRHMTLKLPRCGVLSPPAEDGLRRVCDLRLGHPGEHRQLAPGGDWVWGREAPSVPSESAKPETSFDTKAIVRELRRIRKELVLIRQKVGLET